MGVPYNPGNWQPWGSDKRCPAVSQLHAGLVNPTQSWGTSALAPSWCAQEAFPLFTARLVLKGRSASWVSTRSLSSASAGCPPCVPPGSGVANYGNPIQSTSCSYPVSTLTQMTIENKSTIKGRFLFGSRIMASYSPSTYTRIKYLKVSFCSLYCILEYTAFYSHYCMHSQVIVTFFGGLFPFAS